MLTAHLLFACFNTACTAYTFAFFSPFSMGVVVTVFINVGLVWDNSILALGGHIPSDLLESLSRPRFWLHSFVPILAITLCEAIDRTSIKSDFMLTRISMFTSLLISVYHLSTLILGKGLELQQKSANGIVHFTRKHFSAADIVPAVLITLGAIVVGANIGSAGLSAGALAMLAVAGAFPPGRHPYGGVLSNLGECCLMAGFAALESHLRLRGL